ncbi:hypothetical protein CSUI_007720 [Cystoisospora suis]|uniref:Uncharacterized protein n=1 Tax=Cystoisospora suis TaxID=483139 RepID=A0A2C6KPQ0_9APIC|nr:hypothetical protein CSUI_007720 [Cystoisospora suis]
MTIGEGRVTYDSLFSPFQSCCRKEEFHCIVNRNLLFTSLCCLSVVRRFFILLLLPL